MLHLKPTITPEQCGPGCNGNRERHEIIASLFTHHQLWVNNDADLPSKPWEGNQSKGEFSLIYLLKGISTPYGYLMPKF